MSVYKNIIQNALDACNDYRSKKITLDYLPGLIANAAEQIVLIEEKELREFLFDLAGELNIVQYTIDDDKIYDAALKLVEEIEARLHKEL